LCVAVDVEGYSRRPVSGQRAIQVSLARTLGSMWQGLPVDLQVNGDGAVGVASAEVDPAVALPELLQRLSTESERPDDDDRIRLRVAAHAGHVEQGANGFVGNAVVRTCRLLDSAVLRTALGEHTHAALALLLSDSLYEDVVGHGRGGLMPADFIAVRVADARKSFGADAHLHIPGVRLAAAPADTGPAQSPTFRVDVAGGGRVGTVVQIGELHGGLALPPAGPADER
jgi:hypothetical protein